MDSGSPSHWAHVEAEDCHRNQSAARSSEGQARTKVLERRVLIEQKDFDLSFLNLILWVIHQQIHLQVSLLLRQPQRADVSYFAEDQVYHDVKTDHDEVLATSEWDDEQAKTERIVVIIHLRQYHY